MPERVVVRQNKDFAIGYWANDSQQPESELLHPPHDGTRHRNSIRAARKRSRAILKSTSAQHPFRHRIP